MLSEFAGWITGKQEDIPDSSVFSSKSTKTHRTNSCFKGLLSSDSIFRYIINQSQLQPCNGTLQYAVALIVISALDIKEMCINYMWKRKKICKTISVWVCDENTDNWIYYSLNYLCIILYLFIHVFIIFESNKMQKI